MMELRNQSVREAVLSVRPSCFSFAFQGSSELDFVIKVKGFD